MGDGRAEDPPAAMVDTGLLNNFFARWFVGLVQFLCRIRTIESHATKRVPLPRALLWQDDWCWVLRGCAVPDETHIPSLEVLGRLANRNELHWRM
jgi:hypothetical protein